MKQPALIALVLLFIFTGTTGYSQTGAKPKQFSNFPDLVNCTEATLSSIFNTAPGQSIRLSFSDDFSFAGDVVSNVVKYSNLQSAAVRSPAFNNSVFSISRITNADNSVSYTGRIINKNYFDGYELKKNVAGNYQLVKIETDRVIPDCLQQ